MRCTDPTTGSVPPPPSPPPSPSPSWSEEEEEEEEGHLRRLMLLLLPDSILAAAATIGELRNPAVHVAQATAARMGPLVLRRNLGRGRSTCEAWEVSSIHWTTGSTRCEIKEAQVDRWLVSN